MAKLIHTVDRPNHFRWLFFTAALIVGANPENAYAQFSLVGGNIVLGVTTGQPALEPVAVVNTATSLRYRRQTVITKITVQSTCPAQRYSLRVLAVAPSAGIAAPEVTLLDGMPATDFIRDIPPIPPNKNFTATLQYTASSTYAQGNSTELGDDVHTVVYTQVAQ